MIRGREQLGDLALAAVLLAAILPWAPGATFSHTGEQLSLGIPIATVLLLAGLALRLLLSASRPLPFLPYPIMAFVIAIACGQFGTGMADLKTTLKELIQLGEISLLAVWLAQIGTRWRVRATFRNVLTAVEVALLVLAVCGGLSLLGLSDAKWSAFVVLAAPFAVVAVGRCCPWLGIVLGGLAGLAFPHPGFLLLWCLVVAVACVVLGRRHLPILVAIPIALSIACLPSRSHIWNRLDPHYDATHLRRSMIEVQEAVDCPYYAPLGAGLGQYKKAINQLRAYGEPEPHPDDSKVPKDGNSQYLALLVESGVLGAGAFLYLLVLAFLTACRRDPRDLPDEKSDRMAVALAIMGLAGASIFSLTLSRGIGIWAGMLVGLAFEPGCQIGARRRLVRILLCWGLVGLLLLLSLFVNAGDNQWPSRANRLVASLYSNTPAIRQGPRVVVLPDEYGGQTGDVFTVEAESALEVMPPFVVVRTAGASGDEALAIPEGRGKGIGRATLSVDVPKAGQYVFFARVQWADGCGNSIAFSYADQEIRLSDELYHEWHQVEGRVPVELPAGTVTFQAVNLEDGVMVDYIGLRPASD
jgi:GNAT superfamily N-acetyltransferase